MLQDLILVIYQYQDIARRITTWLPMTQTNSAGGHNPGRSISRQPSNAGYTSLGLLSIITQMVIAFRGTQTTKEWIEDFTASMMHLDGEPEEKGFARYFNRQVQHINPLCYTSEGKKCHYKLEDSRQPIENRTVIPNTFYIIHVHYIQI